MTLWKKPLHILNQKNNFQEDEANFTSFKDFLSPIGVGKRYRSRRFFDFSQ